MTLPLSGCSSIWDYIVEFFSAGISDTAENYDGPPSEESTAPAEAEKPPATYRPAAGPDEAAAETEAAEPTPAKPEAAEPRAAEPEAAEPEAVETTTQALATPPPPEPEASEAPAESWPRKPAPTESWPRKPAPRAAAPRPGTATIQLASVKTEDWAQELWAQLQRRFPDLLGGRELRIQREDLGDRGIYYRVRTSRYPDRASAERVCAQLKAQGQDCLVYVSAPLTERDPVPDLSEEQRRELFEKFLEWQQES